MNTERISLEFDKERILSKIGGSIFPQIFFVCLFTYNHHDKQDIILIIVYGLSLTAFFVLANFTRVKKLFIKEPAIVIDKEGIIDSSNLYLGGKVVLKWDDISRIVVTKNIKGNFLVLIIKNPQEYLNNIMDNEKRKKVEKDFSKYGENIRISVDDCRCDLNLLKYIAEINFESHKAMAA